jgi:hypothetical protein
MTIEIGYTSMLSAASKNSLTQTQRHQAFVPHPATDNTSPHLQSVWICIPKIF